MTQEKDTVQYMATMEAAYRSTEMALFYNIDSTSYPSSLVPGGYPVDATTAPNDSVARVNGNGHKIGPAIILKVMAGDKFDVGVKSFYRSGGVTSSPNNPLPDLLNSLAAGLASVGAARESLSQLQNPTNNPLAGALSSFESVNDPTPNSTPKAYLNWILLDDQLKYDSLQSGAIPVGAADTLVALARSGINVNKNGYLYIWVSNETPNWDVFFDNLSVKTYSSPVLEETHYYPFGLTMAAISDKALKTGYAENKFRFNKGSELQNKEFSDGSGLEMYETGFRSYDPQIGRFHQIDPLAIQDMGHSPYVYCQNNPVLFIDPTGLRYGAYVPQPFEAPGDWSEVLGGGGAGAGGAGWAGAGPGGNGEDNNVVEIFNANNYSTPQEAAVAVYISLLRATGQTPSTTDTYLVQMLYQATWAGQATGISADLLPDGIGLNYTATSSGQSYTDMHISNDQINQLISNYSNYGDLESGNEQSDLTWENKTNIVNGAFSIGWGYKEGLFDYVAAGDATLKELSYFKVVKGVSKGLFVLQGVVSGIQVGVAWNNSDGNWRTNDGNKWGVTGKAALDIAMAAVGTFGGPIGWAVAGTYFLLDATGALGKWGEVPE